MAYYTSGISSPACIDLSHSTDRKVGDEYVQLIYGGIYNSQNEINPEILLTESFRVVMNYRILQNISVKFVPNFHFYTAEGICAFVTSVDQTSVLDTGEYLAECHIPANFLNEGSYFIGLAISSFESGVRVHFFEQNILSFNIKDDLQRTLGRQHGYVGRIPGVIRPQLRWNIQAVL